MKTALKAELLRWCTQRKDQGFTLLELTIVLVISGILAAIALPSFLNQASKAKQVEAKMYLGTLNRAQQGYMLEHAQFTDDINKLGIAFYNSPNYSYSIRLDGKGDTYAIHEAESLSAQLRPYVGMAAKVQDGAGQAVDTLLCESNEAQQGKAADPTYTGAAVACSAATKPIGE